MIYTINEIRRIIYPIAQTWNIRAVYLFGSYARGTATEESDIDLLVDTAGSTITGLMSLGGLYCDLEDALKKKIDLITVNSLEQPTNKPGQLHFRENVRRERIEIYDAA